MVPARIIQSMLLVGIAVTLASIWLGACQPGAAVHFLERNGKVMVSADGRLLPSPVLQQGAHSVAILPMDLARDSDVFDTPETLQRFGQRQTRLAAMMRAPGAQIAAGDQVFAVTRARGIAGNPPAFWIILIPGLIGIAVSAIVLAADPRALPNRLVALTGLLFPMVLAGSSVTISRSLAVDGDLYRWLMFSHDVSGMGFAFVMLALFCVYPCRIVPVRWLGPAAIAACVWIVAIETGRLLAWTGSHETEAAGFLVTLAHSSGGSQMTVSVVFVALCVTLAVQSRATRHDPLARAALTWFGLAVALGAGGTMAILTLPNLIGVRAPVSGVVGFPLLLLIYAGLTFGLLRYRLFEAKAWSFRILFAVCATALLWIVDAVVIYGLGLDQGPALGLSVILVGAAYLPARAKLATLLGARQRLSETEMFGAAVEVAFAPPAQRMARWQALMLRLFDPLEIDPWVDGSNGGPDAETSIVENGTAMLVPDPVGGGMVRLGYPGRGSRLFSPEDRTLVSDLTVLCRHAAKALRSYDRGAADERQRMAQDLHDDIGARLLSGIHVAEGPIKSLLQDALRDIRTLVTGLIGDSAPIARVIANIRHETASRLEAVNIALDWPILPVEQDHHIPYAMSKAMTSAIREAVSNTIRHAGATCLRVTVTIEQGRVTIVIADDGCGIDAAAARGNGLNNMAHRMAAIGGQMHLTAAAGTQLTLRWPLESVFTRIEAHYA